MLVPLSSAHCILAVLNKSHLIALQDWIYKFSIKDDADVEDIIEAASLLKGIIFAIYSAKDNTLPKELFTKFLKVIQTSSVDLFNQGFKRLEDDKEHAATIKEINPHRLLSMSDSQVLGNTIKSFNYILAYATTTHRKMTNNGSSIILGILVKSLMFVVNLILPNH